MKVALALHLFLLALLGGLSWHVGGSPYLLTASMLVLLVHALLSRRLGQVAEGFRLIASAFLLIVWPLHDGNSPSVLWLCLLALPQLLAATQCLSEIQHTGDFIDRSSIRMGRSVFTLGFYASLGLAFLLLRADLFDLARSTGVMLALVSSLSGLVAWEASRAVRLAPGRTVPLTGGGVLGRIALLGLGAAMFALLFAVGLPLASDALCGFVSKLRSPQDLPAPPPREMPDTLPDSTGEGQAGGESEPQSGPELANRSGQVKLPMRGTLELTDEVRVVLKFEDPSQAETLTRQGPLYVRTLAVSKFEADHWVSERPEGNWLKDATDGRLDGNVEVGTPSSGDIAHEVFLLRSNGYALPALAGVTSYALPEVFVLPDHWYQNAATGDLRYKARSKPVNFLSLVSSKPEPGSPGASYFTKLEPPFGTRLTKIADRFKIRGTDLSERLDLLRRFFQTDFTYSTTVENKSGRPPLENFLFVEKKGYCDFFASAAALILRHLGIPSRVAYGYLGGEHDDATDTWIFREYHAHSWTEVFVDGQGWVICDFTPPSSDSSSVAEAAPALDIAQFKDAGVDGIADKPKPWNQGESFQALRSPWLTAVLGLGLLGVFVSFLLRKQGRPEQRAAARAARKRARWEQQPAYFLEFLRMCESLGHPRLQGQTLMEFHRDLKQAQFYQDDFDDLADYYYKSRYEDAPPDEPRERRFLEHIRKFRKART